MERRIRIAKELLTKSGIILISIDENEEAQLKLLCDEIFGESNRLSTHHIKVRYDNKSLNEKNDWQPVMEYVYIYAKDKLSVKAKKPSENYNIDKFLYSFDELTNGQTIILGNKKVTIFKQGEWKINKAQKGSLNLLKETFEIKKTMGTAPIKHTGGNVSRQRG